MSRSSVDFAATARPDEGNQLACGDGKRYAVEGEAACARCVWHGKAFADFVNANA